VSGRHFHNAAFLDCLGNETNHAAADWLRIKFYRVDLNVVLFVRSAARTE